MRRSRQCDCEEAHPAKVALAVEKSGNKCEFRDSVFYSKRNMHIHPLPPQFTQIQNNNSE